MKKDKKKTINNLEITEARDIIKQPNKFENLIKRNPGFVESAVLSVIQKNRAHPEFDDLFQIGLMMLWKALHKWNPIRGKFGTFAYNVIQNGVRQELKKINRRQRDHISMENIRYYGNDAVVGEYKEIKFKETKQINKLRNFEESTLNEIILSEQIKNLNIFEQQVFDLKFKNQYSLNKIAETLEMPLNKLRQWYYTKGGKQKLERIRDNLNE